MADKMTNVKALEFVLANVELPAEVAEKIAKIKTAYENKSTNRKPTKAQESGAEIRKAVVAFLEDNAATKFTASEVLETIKVDFPDATLPKVSAQLTKLKDEGTIERTLEKKKAYFQAKA